MAKECVIGVDLGGTNVRAQAFFADGAPASARFEAPSHAQQGTDAIIRQISLVVNQVQAEAESEPASIGMAVPGHIDDQAGVVRWSPNLGEEVDGVFHYWIDVPLREKLAKHLSLPFTMANDANAAAYGEYKYGSGQGKARCLVMFTIGTGIGGGVVLGPQAVHGGSARPMLLVGGNQGGGELGYLLIQKNGLASSAGIYGVCEAYCQKQAIVNRAVAQLLKGRSSVLNEMLGKDGYSDLDPRHLYEAAEQGDELALDVWRETGEMLGAAVGGAINVFAPDVVAIGGQIAKAHPFILDSLKLSAWNHSIPSLYRDATILPADLIDDAGLLGAAALAHDLLPG